MNVIDHTRMTNTLTLGIITCYGIDWPLIRRGGVIFSR